MNSRYIVDQLRELHSLVEKSTEDANSTRDQLLNQMKDINRRLVQIIDESERSTVSRGEGISGSVCDPFLNYPLPAEHEGLQYDNSLGRAKIGYSSSPHEYGQKFDLLEWMYERLPIPVGISRASDNQILYYNPEWRNTFGYDVSGLNSFDQWWSLVALDDDYQRILRVEWSDRRKAAVEKKGSIEPLEAVVTCADGSIKTVKWGLMSNGFYNINYVLDLTEHKRLETALRESEEKFRQLTEAAPDWIWEMDAEGRITYSNPAIVDITGYRVEEIFGVSAYNFIHPDEIEPIGILLEDCIKNRKGWKNFEKRWIHKDGSIRIFEAAGVPVFDANDKVVGFRGIDRDITEKKRVTDELHRALALAQQLRVQAEAASSAKSKFLANMSHELRTPLNAILGFTELLEGQHYGSLNDRQLDYMEAIHESSSHLLQLINDILDLSKIEAGKIVIEPSSFCLSLLLQNALSMFSATAHKRGLSLEMKTASEFESQDIWADDIRLKQIIINLLSNALEFTPSGGRILLEATLEGEEIQISLSDTGVGIRPEDQDRIFEEFEQADSSFSRLHQGTGLGLPLSRKLVELHGGRIWVESEGENRGSVFRFRIPYVKAGPKFGDEPSESTLEFCDKSNLPLSDNDRPVILVVEDNSANMKLTTNLLEIGGYRTLKAFSSEEAIKQLKTQTPDIILMDISLPGMDGLTATQLIKTSPGTANIPVVALTAHAMRDDEARAVEAGCDAYLEKPVDTRKFYRTISHALQKAKNITR